MVYECMIILNIMNELTQELIIVKCVRCIIEQKDCWLRLENSYPVTMVDTFFNQQSAEMKNVTTKSYLCEEHYDKFTPIYKLEGLELPKN